MLIDLNSTRDEFHLSLEVHNVYGSIKIFETLKYG